MLRQPFNRLEFERLQRDMDRLFEATFSIVQRQRGVGLPAVNIWANKDDGLIITAELPGFEPEDVEISVTGDTLVLKGNRQPVELYEQAQYHRRERTHGEFIPRLLRGLFCAWEK